MNGITVFQYKWVQWGGWWIHWELYRRWKQLSLGETLLKEAKEGIHQLSGAKGLKRSKRLLLSEKTQEDR
jgi:hypothetical protein